MFPKEGAELSAPESPKISFIANHVPPLTDGVYTLALSQTLTGGTDSHTFKKTHTFAVRGERFAFRPDHIHKVFPPANTQGDYDSVLPHVVLSRRTLPWERTAYATGTASTQPIYSWLAVMVFAQSEAPATTNGTLADLYPATTSDSDKGTLPDGTYSYGTATTTVPFLSYGEKAPMAASGSISIRIHSGHSRPRWWICSGLPMPGSALIRMDRRTITPWWWPIGCPPQVRRWLRIWSRWKDWATSCQTTTVRRQQPGPHGRRSGSCRSNRGVSV